LNILLLLVAVQAVLVVMAQVVVVLVDIVPLRAYLLLLELLIR
jgi:hypothetical protein